jgi:polyisoprenoid-binding protein YceI
MKTQFMGILILSSVLITANGPPSDNIYKTYKGSVKILSEAPLEIIKASSQDLRGVIDAEKHTFAFSINNMSITGFNSPLQQQHFYENYIEAQKYPVSTFEGKIIEQVDLSKDGDYTVRAKGILNIHGVEKERIIKSSLRIKNNVFFVSSQFTILLSEHNITIPRVVNQKIAEEIKISVDAEFTGINIVKK